MTDRTYTQNQYDVAIMLKLVEKELRNASAELSNIYSGDLCFISDNPKINDALRAINDLVKGAHRMIDEARGVVTDIKAGEYDN